MTVKDDQLDDVISSLIDDDGEGAGATQGGLPGTSSMPPPPEPVQADGPPVKLTARAAKQIRKIRETESMEEGLFLRVAVEGGGCAGLNYKLGFDYRTEEDEEVESQGLKIIVDPRHMIYLNGITIDYPDGLDARGFTFDNPNASENCGCGASFAV
ncbi:MAG: iron-sulfur cluster assembly accessory protein [Balneolaceae bacterium]